MKPEIRALKISNEDLEQGNVGGLVRVFDKVVGSARNSKSLRGSIMFSFGDHGTDPRSFEKDQVRRYARLIDERYPFFPYFLPRDTDQHLMWLASLATPLEPEPGADEGIAVDPQDFSKLVAARVLAVQSFCEKIRDDPDETVETMLQSVPAEVASAVRAELKS